MHPHRVKGARGADLVAVPVDWVTVVAQPGRSGPKCSSPSENDRRQGRNRLADVDDTKPVTEIVVKEQPKLLAGLHKTKHDVARNTAIRATNYVCAGLIVPPEIFRFVTKLRRAFWDALVCSGISG